MDCVVMIPNLWVNVSYSFKVVYRSIAQLLNVRSYTKSVKCYFFCLPSKFCCFGWPRKPRFNKVHHQVWMEEFSGNRNSSTENETDKWLEYDWWNFRLKQVIKNLYENSKQWSYHLRNPFGDFRAFLNKHLLVSD